VLALTALALLVALVAIGLRAWRGSRGGSTRTFLGVPPGHYELTCWPNPILGAPPGGTPVHVAGDRASIVVEVTLSDP